MDIKGSLLQEHQMLDSILERPSLEGRSFTGTPRLSAFSCSDTTADLGVCSQSSARPSTQSSVAVLSPVHVSAFAEVSASQQGRLPLGKGSACEQNKQQ